MESESGNMGVWHVCGMGTSPGAVTSPLTYVYLILKAATKGDLEAKKLFESSGERDQILKGAPQALIILTSKDVISGTQRDVRDKWLQTPKGRSSFETIAKYLSNLLENLRDSDFSAFHKGEWIDYIYAVEVDHQNFEDCFSKSYVTLSGLRDKEIWINMIAGTNQINSALLIASAFQGVAARYYYIFQNDIELLHPETEKPDFRHPQVRGLISNWYELPIFHLGIGEIIKNLNELFAERQKINTKEVTKMLENLGLPHKSLAKIAGGLIRVDEDTASEGYLLRRWNSIYREVEGQAKSISGFSKWKDWAREEGILWELTLDGAFKKVE